MEALGSMRTEMERMQIKVEETTTASNHALQSHLQEMAALAHKLEESNTLLAAQTKIREQEQTAHQVPLAC